jgi:hypothetical protein
VTPSIWSLASRCLHLASGLAIGAWSGRQAAAPYPQIGRAGLLTSRQAGRAARCR